MVPDPSPDPLSAASGPPMPAPSRPAASTPEATASRSPHSDPAGPSAGLTDLVPTCPTDPSPPSAPKSALPPSPSWGGPEPQRSGLTEHVGDEEQLPAMPPTPDPRCPGLPEAGSHTSGQDWGRGPGPTSCRPLTCSAQLGTGPWQPGVQGSWLHRLQVSRALLGAGGHHGAP